MIARFMALIFLAALVAAFAALALSPMRDAWAARGRLVDAITAMEASLAAPGVAPADAERRTPSDYLSAGPREEVPLALQEAARDAVSVAGGRLLGIEAGADGEIEGVAALTRVVLRFEGDLISVERVLSELDAARPVILVESLILIDEDEVRPGGRVSGVLRLARLTARGEGQ